MDVNNEFGFHPATEDVKPKYRETREAFIELAQWLEDTLPESRHKSLALTNLQQAQMWAIGSIAINQTPQVDE